MNFIIIRSVKHNTTATLLASAATCKITKNPNWHEMISKVEVIFLLVISFSLLLATGCENKTNKNAERIVTQKSSLKENIGEKFQIDNILDSSGKAVKLDFSKSEITIVDFWFNECPPCIEEMKQFEEMLLGKEKKVIVVSISINRFSLWKTTLSEHSGRFSFLSNKVINWKHYNLQSMIDEKLNNNIPKDNTDELIKKFNVTFYPAFFVIDKDGTIISRPISAADFIRQL